MTIFDDSISVSVWFSPLYSFLEKIRVLRFPVLHPLTHETDVLRLQDIYRDVTLMANSFNLRRGRLSMCPGDTCSEELQMRAAERSQASSFIP